MQARRRHVRLVIGAKNGPRVKARLWAYDAYALADLGGCSVGYVRSQVTRGALDPGDLWSVVAWAQERMRRPKPRSAIKGRGRSQGLSS